MTRCETTTKWHQSAFDLSRVIEIREGPDADGHNYVDGRHEVTIARCETIEHARVIAAAPEMLAALHAALVEIDQELEQRKTSGSDEHCEELQAVSDQILAAIGKAA